MTPMDIYCQQGHKVIVTEESAGNGTSLDIENIRIYLDKNKPYAVAYTDIHSWHTDVYLVEIPGVRFNSANFEDYKKGPRIADKQAIDTALDKVHAKYGKALKNLGNS